jgi:hypothetical protein
MELKWEVILMNFIVVFQLTARRHDLIFLVVENLTKSSNFIHVRMAYQELDIARVFINEIVRLHGMPKRIIYNQGLVFTG